jgi:hypothetical protein
MSFPFDLHSAAVFDSHIPCRSPVMPRICLSESDRSRPWQDRGRATASWRHASFRPLAATTPSSRKFVIRRIPISDAGGQCETKQRS